MGSRPRVDGHILATPARPLAADGASVEPGRYIHGPVAGAAGVRGGRGRGCRAARPWLACGAAVLVLASGLAIVADVAPAGAAPGSRPHPLFVPAAAPRPEPQSLADLFGLDGPVVTARAAALVDAGSGRLLWGLRPHLPLPPASTTKIMTALLALELGRLDEEVTVSRGAEGVEGSSLYLRAGDRYPLGELLEGLLLVSANDAAVAIAEHLAGSVENFALLMTGRARSLGLGHTTFRNPHGLTEAGHLTSAYYLARLARFALRDGRFARLVARVEGQAAGRGAAGEPLLEPLWNTNRLLTSYRWAEGVKTGTTAAAGACLVAAAARQGMRLIAVVLDSADRYADSLALLEWGFANFASRNLAPAGLVMAEESLPGGAVLPLAPARDLRVALPRRVLPHLRILVDRDPYLKPPVAAGRRVGLVTAVAEGVVLGRVPLLTARAVARPPFWRRWFTSG